MPQKNKNKLILVFFSYLCLPIPEELSRNPCFFSPYYFSCHFDSIMQDLCWVHNPLKWGKGSVIQLLKLQHDSSGPERKPSALIPLSPRESSAIWLFLAAIWYIHCFKCWCWVSDKGGITKCSILVLLLV